MKYAKVPHWPDCQNWFKNGWCWFINCWIKHIGIEFQLPPQYINSVRSLTTLLYPHTLHWNAITQKVNIRLLWNLIQWCSKEKRRVISACTDTSVSYFEQCSNQLQLDLILLWSTFMWIGTNNDLIWLIAGWLSNFEKCLNWLQLDLILLLVNFCCELGVDFVIYHLFEITQSRQVI